MESEITPLLAGLVSVLDIGANLNLIWRGEPENDHGSATKRLWIELFKEDVSFLDVSYVQTSSVYFENDDEGGLRARNEFPIDSTLPEFETPFYFALASKILQAVKMMESARGKAWCPARVRFLTGFPRIFRKSAPWRKGQRRRRLSFRVNVVVFASTGLLGTGKYHFRRAEPIYIWFLFDRYHSTQLSSCWPSSGTGMMASASRITS